MLNFHKSRCDTLEILNITGCGVFLVEKLFVFVQFIFKVVVNLSLDMVVTSARLGEPKILKHSKKMIRSSGMCIEGPSTHKK